MKKVSLVILTLSNLTNTVYDIEPIVKAFLQKMEIPFNIGQKRADTLSKLARALGLTQNAQRQIEEDVALTKQLNILIDNQKDLLLESFSKDITKLILADEDFQKIRRKFYIVKCWEDQETEQEYFYAIEAFLLSKWPNLLKHINDNPADNAKKTVRQFEDFSEKVTELILSDKLILGEVINKIIRHNPTQFKYMPGDAQDILLKNTGVYAKVKKALEDGIIQYTDFKNKYSIINNKELLAIINNKILSSEITLGIFDKGGFLISDFLEFQNFREFIAQQIRLGNIKPYTKNDGYVLQQIVHYESICKSIVIWAENLDQKEFKEFFDNTVQFLHSSSAYKDLIKRKLTDANFNNKIKESIRNVIQLYSEN